jgi:sigma-B regulation protein RsbU (phosphoserine phosphatase)
MDGYTVCEQLKADELTRDIPIIFISALGETEDKVRAFGVGGVDYVTKPFHVEEVLARVRTHLSLRKLQRQLQEANRKMEQEMILAGEVQASFLPRRPPDIPGWQLAVTLKPARETSGDFYDFHFLPDGRLAIVVADVVDKGAGAALYMVLSWSLLRTCAPEYPAQPELSLGEVNRRILVDTHAEEFVTVFYGVLDPATGAMAYCNAGHNPPYLVHGQEFQELGRTGIPLGIFEDVTWERGVVQMAPGDVLVLYTDGVIDAQNPQEALFGEERLRRAVRAQQELPPTQGSLAQDIRDAIVADIGAFVGDAAQLDDITLLVVARDAAGG